MASLLKAYQEEVDSLTTRAKLGEAAFLEVFKQLYEAPDPAPAIAQGLVRLMKLPQRLYYTSRAFIFGKGWRKNGMKRARMQGKK
jgi:hypothetical protein